jgi:hypothetical protein
MSFLSLTAATKYDQILSELTSIQASNTDKSSIFSIGNNDQGDPIKGIEINYGSEAGKHLIVAVHHGNEAHSATIAMKTIRLLLQEKNLLGTYYIIPVLNISGYNINSRYEYSKSGKSVDPNRDHQDPCTDHPYHQLISSELIDRFVSDNNIISLITIHGYVGSFTYPWGIFTKDTEPKPILMYYTRLASIVSNVNHYNTGTHTDLLYGTVGAFEDYTYNFLGVWSFLLEVAYNPNILIDATALVEYMKNAPDKKPIEFAHPIEMCDHSQKMSLEGRP